MSRLLTPIVLACAFGIALVAVGTTGGADELVIRRDAAQRFATLPVGVRFPEGITANPTTRDIFVATFDFGSPNALVRLDRQGRVEALRSFGGTPLIGLAFHAATNKVYLANFGASKIQRIDADFGPATPIEDVADVPSIGPPGPRLVPNPDGTSDTITFGNGFAAPNGLAFGPTGSLYFSDSFQGAIFRIDNPTACGPGCAVATVKHDPLLATAGFPPFGANGLAFGDDASTLFVANTGDDRILKLNLTSNTLTVFAESIDGADGLAFADGVLWVAANQADEILGLNSDGRVVVRLGEFKGVRPDGSPRGLSFPASLVIVGERMFVANTSLPLTLAVGDEPEEDVTVYTISRLRIPKP